MTEIKPIWEKKLRNFTLLEYPKEPNLLNCTVFYEYEEAELTFCFGSWEMDKESITEEDCLLCYQAMIYCEANVSISSFGASLEWARNEFFEEDEEE